jgi:D-alanyl-lipoteichoic acid acyltransferase DltB (MBOAT superfamily)
MTLLSIEFISLSVALILWMRVTRGWLRLAGFIVGSAIYAGSFLTPLGLVSTSVLILCGFALARLVARFPTFTSPAVALLVAGFAYLRGYDLILAALPQGFWTPLFATAGLSYLLFKIIHIVVDSSSGRMSGMSLMSYLAYCLNFTTFLLGPIQRYQSFVDQWDGRVEPLGSDLVSHLDATNRVLRGFLKKWVVAEMLGGSALLPGGSIEGMGPGEVLVASWIFYLYLYFDFSGYCDVVIGMGRLMGVAPPENFWLPFLSPNIAQYWLRVHRSLTEWLTDYVFQPVYAALLRSPLMGAHRLASRNVAIALTMIVAGVWHGTTLSFLLFGLVHAAYQVVYRTSEHLLTARLGAQRVRALRSRWNWTVASTALTFVATASAYVFFLLTPAQLMVLLTGIRSRL